MIIATLGLAAEAGAVSFPPAEKVPSELGDGPFPAIEGDGDAHLLWEQAGSMVSSTRPFPAGPFGPVGTLGVGSSAMTVDVNAAGSGVAVWYDGVSDTLRSSTLSPGVGWSASAAGPAADPYDLAKVVVAPSGDALFATAENEETLATYYRPAGGSWGAKDEADTATSNLTLYDLDMNATGEAIAYYTAAEPDFELRSVFRTAGSAGDWQADQDIVTFPPPTTVGLDSPLGPGIEFLSDGRVVAVWRQQDTGPSPDLQTVAGAVRSAGTGGSWGSPAPLWSRSSNQSYDQPNVAADGQGNAVAAWGAGSQIHVRRFKGSTSSWLPPHTVTECCLLDSGLAMAQADGAHGVAYFTRPDPDNVGVITSDSIDSPWSGQTLLGPGEYGTASRPEAASGGRMLVSWAAGDYVYGSVSGATGGGPGPPGGGPPPPGGGPSDTTVAFSASAKKAQNLLKQKAVLVGVGCGAEACTVSAKGTLSVPGASKVYRLKGAKRSLAAGKRVTLKLKLTKKVLGAVKRALRKKRKVAAKLTVRAVDAAGNSKQRKLTVTAKR